MSADFAKTNHGPSASWARFVPEQAVVIPGSSARILESQPIQANVAEEQYSLKLIGFGHGNPLPWCCLTERSLLGARTQTIAPST
jgi:hypothetical protein